MNKQRTITGDTALRLGHFFGTNPEYWLNLQATYDLCLAGARVGADIKSLPTLPMRKKKPASQQAATA
jgi:plasmid maintenance system antidote protein VapI